MIKQDYLIRMIQEIISLIVNAILNKKKFRKDEWTEYDCLNHPYQIVLFNHNILFLN